MENLLETAFLCYDAEEPFGFSACYHWFNILEGLVWLVFSALVLLRFLRHRKSRIELCWCAFFAAFGVSDFVEARQQSSWLIWLKLFNLYGLVRTREHVMRRLYPEARVYQTTLSLSCVIGEQIIFCGVQQPSRSETKRRCLTLAGLERTFGFRRSCGEFSERFEDVLVRRV